MLDLVVQAAEQEIDEAAGSHVAGRQDLSAGEVVRAVLGQDRHRDVVRGEDEAQVHAHRNVMHDREEQRGRDAERRGEDAGVRREMHGQDDRLGSTLPRVAAENDGDALVP